MSSPPIEVRNLHKQYKGARGPTATSPCPRSPEKSWASWGPNGAGKTTLVRQVTTELLPRSGDVRVFELAVLAGFTVVMMSLGTWKLPRREK